MNAADPVLGVSSTNVSFGNVIAGQTATQSVTVTSSGNVPVTISGLAVSGSQFSASGVTTPLTLNPGQTATLVLTFKPNQVSSFTGAVTISNTSSTGSLAVNMTGSGLSPLTGLSCSQTSMTGAGTDACTVSLSAPAPTGGLAVSLASNNSSVSVPASVTVPAGATSAAFNATVSSSTSAQSVTLTATADSASVNFAIQLNTSTPTLTVSSTTVAFGNLTVGQTATKTVTLSSTGTAPVTISGLSIVGSLFTSSGITTPLTLNPGQSATLTLSFYASQVSNFTGVLTISSNSSTGNLVVNMTASGLSPLTGLSCSQTSMTGSGTDACTVSLNSPALAGGLVVSLASNNSSVSVPASVTVPAGATSAAFSATVSASTSSQSATLTATAEYTSVTFTLQLNTSTPTLTVSSTMVAFGNLTVGQTATKTVTLSSTGTAPVTISGLSIVGSLFTSSGITTPLTLNPGQSATLTLSFYASQVSNFTGVLTISSNSSTGNLVVNMTGSGVAAPGVLNGVSCGNASLTGAGSDACTVSLNAAAGTGGLVVNLASSSSAVSVPASVTVLAGATSASFTANVSAVSSAQSVMLTATSGSVVETFSIQLNTGTASISVNSSSVAFGDVVINTPATQSITITSTGTSAVTLNSATASGSGFSVTGITFPITLNPGQSATLNIQFDPASTGAATGNVTITSNCSGGGSTVISLSGTAEPHEVALSWNAPTSSTDPVVGYNVYRTISGGSSYQRLNSSPVTQTSYTDTTGQSNVSYEYYVTSVDSSGNESTQSNLTSVTIP
ncbi:MAG TPA: choice-of-anchor D domain-containing protein [Terracidiphilus sp.]|nr:choice-of-anchor D domain-containing protein [Terracidiphilus sp.]